MVQVSSNERSSKLSLRSISWAAVFAGVVVVMVAQLVVSLLGIGIGASTVSPMTQQSPLEGLGLGTAIWFAISTIICLFLGGWVAGRLAAIPGRLERALHGVLTWSIATLATFYLLTTAIGGLISGAAGVLGSTISAAGQGMASITPQTREQIERSTGVKLDDLRAQAGQLLQESGRPELQPDLLRDEAERALTELNSASARAKSPESDQEARSAIEKVVNRSPGQVNAADRQKLVELVADRTGKSRDESGRMVSRWESVGAQARARLEQVTAQAEEKARQAGEAAATGISKAALLTFALLLVGGISAAIGGMSAYPREYERDFAAV